MKQLRDLCPNSTHLRELVAHQDDIAFHHKLVPTVTRSVRLTNTLPFAVAIWNASVVGDERDAFEV